MLNANSSRQSGKEGGAPPFSEARIAWMWSEKPQICFDLVTTPLFNFFLARTQSQNCISNQMSCSKFGNLAEFVKYEIHVERIGKVTNAIDPCCYSKQCFMKVPAKLKFCFYVYPIIPACLVKPVKCPF